MAKNKKSRFLAVALLVVVLFIFLFNFILQSAVTFAASQLTGAAVKIGTFKLNLFRQEVSIRDFVLYNPPGFPNTALIDIPEITVAVKSQALLQGSLHLPLVILNLREMTLIKTKEGKLNVDSLRFVQRSGEDGSQPAKNSQKAMPFKIDRMNLTIGKVVYKDYSAGGSEPKVKTYDIGMKNKEFKNVTSPQQFASLLLVQAMTPTAVHSAAVTAISTVQNLESLTVDKAAGFLNRIKEKLK